MAAIPKGFIQLRDRMGFEIVLRANAVTAVVNTGTLVQVAVMGMSEPIKVNDDFQSVVSTLEAALK